MIKTKEDFRGKYINLPKNISEKKLCTIKDKFKKLGLDLQIKGRKKHGYDVQVILNPRGELKYYFGTEEFLRDTFTQISIKKFLAEEETKKIIKTKEDFEGKYIELPKNLSEKKFNKIKNKFIRIGYNVTKLHFKDVDFAFVDFGYKQGEIGIFIAEAFIIHKYCLGIWKIQRKNKLQKISIKDFLKEEETIDYNLHNIGDKRYNVVQLEDYNCIPNNYLTFYGTNLNTIKEDVERAIQGFSYGKPKKFDNIKRALNWCFLNPMKEISYETSCSGFSRTRYNERLEQFENYNKELKQWKWNSYFRTSSPSLWKNIREYRPTKMKLGEVIKKGLRFKFKGETWRKSPQGFTLDSKGNSLKSNVLLDNINTKVEII